MTREVLATVGLRVTQGQVFVGLFSSELLKVGFWRGEDAHEGILMLKWGCFMEKGTWTLPAVSRVRFRGGEQLPVLGSFSAHGQPRPLLLPLTQV